MVRGWESKDKPVLKPTDLEFLEIETFKNFGYGDWRRWKSEPLGVRIRFMAHELEKSARAGYEYEQRMERGDSGKGTPPNTGGSNLFSQMKGAWGYA